MRWIPWNGREPPDGRAISDELVVPQGSSTIVQTMHAVESLINRRAYRAPTLDFISASSITIDHGRSDEWAAYESALPQTGIYRAVQ